VFLLECFAGWYRWSRASSPSWPHLTPPKVQLPKPTFGLIRWVFACKPCSKKDHSTFSNRLRQHLAWERSIPMYLAKFFFPLLVLLFLSLLYVC
jgi:hypothetical protein